MSNAAPAAGWFPDPHDPAQLRWWDGSSWSENVHLQDGDRPPDSLPALDAPLFVTGRTPDAMGAFARFRSALLGGWDLQRVIRIAALLVASYLLVRFGWDALVSSGSRGSAKGSMLLIIIGLALPIIWLHMMWQAATKAFVAAWASGRGFATAIGSPITAWLDDLDDASLPILHTGDSRRFSDLLVGTVGGIETTLGTLRVVSDNDSLLSSGPSSTRSYDVAAFEIPAATAARIPAISVRERSVLRRSGGDDLGRIERFESIEVDQRLRILAGPGSNPVAVRELFGPQLLAALADTAVSWDQRGRRLLVYTNATNHDAPARDAFCAVAAAIARAYWSEQQ